MSTPKIISERDQKSLQYIAGYVVHKSYTKFKFSKNKDREYSKQCSSILLCCKTDSDNTQILINSQDRGGLWRVNDNAQNIFIECDKIDRLSTSNFQTVIQHNWFKKCKAVPMLFQILMHYVTILNQRLTKKISLNLLENVLLLFTKVRVFSFTSDVKERFKARIKKPKSRLLRKEIKKASSS